MKKFLQCFVLAIIIVTTFNLQAIDNESMVHPTRMDYMHIAMDVIKHRLNHWFGTKFHTSLDHKALEDHRTSKKTFKELVHKHVENFNQRFKLALESIQEPKNLVSVESDDSANKVTDTEEYTGPYIRSFDVANFGLIVANRDSSKHQPKKVTDEIQPVDPEAFKKIMQHQQVILTDAQRHEKDNQYGSAVAGYRELGMKDELVSVYPKYAKQLEKEGRPAVAAEFYHAAGMREKAHRVDPERASELDKEAQGAFGFAKDMLAAQAPQSKNVTSEEQRDFLEKAQSYEGEARYASAGYFYRKAGMQDKAQQMYKDAAHQYEQLGNTKLAEKMRKLGEANEA